MASKKKNTTAKQTGQMKQFGQAVSAAVRSGNAQAVRGVIQGHTGVNLDDYKKKQSTATQSGSRFTGSKGAVNGSNGNRYQVDVQPNTGKKFPGSMVGTGTDVTTTKLPKNAPNGQHNSNLDDYMTRLAEFNSMTAKATGHSDSSNDVLLSKGSNAPVDPYQQ